LYSRDYVIIDNNIARIKTPHDHWYISTFYSWDYVIIDHNIARYSGNVIVNDYVVPAVQCRDIPMIVRPLYSGSVIVNDYVVPAVKCRDIPMVVRRLYSGNVIINDYVVLAVKCRDIPMGDYVIIDYNIARIMTPDDH
jgi:hypothetical protein